MPSPNKQTNKQTSPKLCIPQHEPNTRCRVRNAQAQVQQVWIGSDRSLRGISVYNTLTPTQAGRWNSNSINHNTCKRFAKTKKKQTGLGVPPICHLLPGVCPFSGSADIGWGDASFFRCIQILSQCRGFSSDSVQQWILPRIRLILCNSLLLLSLHSTLYLSMKDPDKGIRELKLEKDKKIFNHCFTGRFLFIPPSF